MVVEKLEDRGKKSRGDVHYGNVVRLKLHSAILYGTQVNENVNSFNSGLTVDLVRGKRTLERTRTGSVPYAELAEITESIYQTIAFTLEAKREKR